MQAAVKWGLILAGVITIWNPIWVLTGLYTSVPASLGYLAVVITLNIVAVILSLRESSAENGYLKQLGSGVVLGLVAGIGIFVTSWLMMTYIFPDMVANQVAGFTEFYENSGLPEDQQQQLIEAASATTPANNAFQGANGAFFTSAVVGAIAGIFLRRK